MKKALMFILCALMVFAFAACGEKEVSNSVPGFPDAGGSSGSTYDDSYVEDDEALLDIQDIIGFWNATEIYQAPRASDSQFASDEEALLNAQGSPVQISANEFDSPLCYTDNAVFKKVTVSLDSLSDYGIQVDETLEALASDGNVTRLDIYDGDAEYPIFQVFLLDSSTMLYEGDGYFFLASHEESVG